MVGLLCTIDFTEFLMKLLPGKNSDEILWILHHRPIFHVVRLYVIPMYLSLGQMRCLSASLPNITKKGDSFEC